MTDLSVKTSINDPDMGNLVFRWFELRFSQRRDIATELGLADPLITDCAFPRLESTILIRAGERGKLGDVARLVAEMEKLNGR